MPFLSLGSSKEDLYYVWRASQDRSDAGLTLLFIHGLGSSSSFYAPVIPRLVNEGFSCLAFDTRGSCLSKNAGRDQSIQDIANDAKLLLQALNIPQNKTIAVGHSMGGMVASTLAAECPLAGAVLLGTVTPSSALADAFTQRIKKIEQEGIEAMADSIPPQATGSKSTPTHHAFIRALLLAQTAEGYASLCRTIATAETPSYKQARCPVLFISGGDDKVSPVHAQEAIMQSWGSGESNAQLKILDRVGHWHCVEAGDEVGELLVEFARIAFQSHD